MSIVDIERIKIGVTAKDKKDAILIAGKLLVDTGCVDSEYVSGMLAREETMSTYLGEGVAIPHGQFENREMIHKTGISVVQLETPIEWEPGENAKLIIGIAASSDEHITVLTNLAEAIEDENKIKQLLITKDPKVIMDILS